MFHAIWPQGKGWSQKSLKSNSLFTNRHSQMFIFFCSYRCSDETSTCGNSCHWPSLKYLKKKKTMTEVPLIPTVWVTLSISLHLLKLLSPQLLNKGSGGILVDSKLRGSCKCIWAIFFLVASAQWCQMPCREHGAILHNTLPHPKCPQQPEIARMSLLTVMIPSQVSVYSLIHSSTLIDPLLYAGHQASLAEYSRNPGLNCILLYLFPFLLKVFPIHRTTWHVQVRIFQFNPLKE